MTCITHRLTRTTNAHRRMRAQLHLGSSVESLRVRKRKLTIPNYLNVWLFSRPNLWRKIYQHKNQIWILMQVSKNERQLKNHRTQCWWIVNKMRNNSASESFWLLNDPLIVGNGKTAESDKNQVPNKTMNFLDFLLRNRTRKMKKRPNTLTLLVCPCFSPLYRAHSHWTWLF